MESFKIRFPSNVQIDIFNLPSDFETIVTNCFKEYTEGTAKSYRFVDKLGFIDCFVNKINNGINENMIVDDCYKSIVEYRWEEFDETVDDEDVYCKEFMCDCARRGMESSRLEQTFNQDDIRIYEQIQRVLVKVITIIMNYED